MKKQNVYAMLGTKHIYFGVSSYISTDYVKLGQKSELNH